MMPSKIPPATDSPLTPVRRPRHAADAFSLIELILVLAILALGATMTWPNLWQFAKGRQSINASVRLLAMTRYAQDQAVAQATSHRLHIDPEAGTCWLTVQRDGPFVMLTNDLGQRHRIPAGHQIAWEIPPLDSDGTSFIQFDPDGQHSVAAIRLTDADGRRRYLAAPTPTQPFVVSDVPPVKISGTPIREGL